jgi:hypothetical protein
VPAIAEAHVEEVPGEEIPEVVAEVTTPAPGRVPPGGEEAEEYVEEVPPEAVVDAVVDEIPDGDEGEFELLEEVPPEPEEPKTIETAHEELLGKLLGK